MAREEGGISISTFVETLEGGSLGVCARPDPENPAIVIGGSLHDISFRVTLSPEQAIAVGQAMVTEAQQFTIQALVERLKG